MEKLNYHVLYSEVSNNHAGWNKSAGWKIYPQLINMQAGIIMQVGKILTI